MLQKLTEMETHNQTTADRSDPQGIDLGIEKILHAVPSKRPAEARKVYHHDSSSASVFLRGSKFKSFFVNTLHSRQEGGDITHRYCLKCNSDRQGAFSSNSIDEE